MEAAMAAAEDEEDISALKVAKAEAIQDEAEFDENAVVDNRSDDDASVDSKDEAANAKQAAKKAAAAAKEAAEKEEKDMEAEFASWQAKLGPDFSALESALKPVERFALRFRTDPNLDPFYSMHFIAENDRLLAMADGPDHEAEAWDVEEIEREKEEEEYRALSEGELLATNLTRQEISRFKSWFIQERSKRGRARRRRLLTGECWTPLRDPRTDTWYWYNRDTGEKKLTKPKILVDMEVLLKATGQGYNSVPSRIILHIMSFLAPLPDRLRASEVCRSWRDATRDPIFFKRVMSVETGASDSTNGDGAAVKLASNTFASVTDAMAAALPGDTIQLTPGHHWETSLELRMPLRIVGDVSDPGRCVLELTGRLFVDRPAKHVDLQGVTIRRPRKLPQAAACLQINGAKLSVRVPSSTRSLLVCFCASHLVFSFVSLYPSHPPLLYTLPNLKRCSLARSTTMALQAAPSSPPTAPSCSFTAAQYAGACDRASRSLDLRSSARTCPFPTTLGSVCPCSTARRTWRTRTSLEMDPGECLR